jgi:membrane-bound lytic murein transglycosylase D
MKPPHMDIAVAARLAEISVEEFVSLNPAYQRPVMDGNQGSSLVLPADKVDVFRANLERHEARDIPLSNWQTYQMKKGDTLDKIAAHHSIGTASLKQINGIGPRLKTGPGFNLLVPRPGSRVAHDLMARILPPVPPAPPAKPVVRPTATKKSPAANRTATKAKSARKPETKAPAQKRKKR